MHDRLWLAVVFILSLIATAVRADNDPNRPVVEVSEALGVTQEQFKECFMEVKPAAHAELPSEERKRANKRILLSCLQKYNLGLDDQKLNAVMDQYRPGGRASQ